MAGLCAIPSKPLETCKTAEAEPGSMKIVWKKTKEESGKKRSRLQSVSPNPNLPFESLEVENNKSHEHNNQIHSLTSEPDSNQLAESFESQGIQLAENGKFKEALVKWETAISLMPDRAKLHEQKAQVLLEIGDTWNSLKAATRATELEPNWAEAWITLGRAQLNFGEPDMAVVSFDKALVIKPDDKEARSDRQTASNLIKRRKQLHSSGLSSRESRYKVGEGDGFSMPHDELVRRSEAE
ncbi:hypothetical protein AXF42_Ash011635 [Apostasia shenzhenica]|uniref:Uncharacterized protein n=1 Tax=Apostasia shenzhenica TaxID=1088818 RepID=A0A2H9ZUI7_9ASPA|nr:hypothetical protein AXF42_Ash011635 [Apostasia shenzhenica]